MERRSVSMRAEDGSSSSMQMVAEAKMPEKQGTVKGKESMGVDERDGEHDYSSSSSRVVEMQLGGGSRRSTEKKGIERSMSKAEDETSSSSWMQMVAEAKMLQAPPAFSKEMLALALSTSIEEMEESSAESEEKVVEGSALAEKHDSSSWVVEMQRILDDMERWMKPSIYRVPDWLKSMTKAEAYRPQVVSLGPFHHGEQSLRPMEEHKHRLMLHMVERSKQKRAMFVKAITEVAGKLQDAYYGLDEKWRGVHTDDFVDVMITDGGFLLELMTTVNKRSTGALDAGYAPYDPIFSNRSLLSLWARIRSDMILVENQVPLLALQTLEAVRSGTIPSDAYINELVTDFICPNLEEIRNQENLGLHTLQMLHRKFCGGHSQPLKHQDELDQSETTMLSAEELREAGVHFKRSDTPSVQAIDFKNGVLIMPLVEIDDGSERMFLNLMAFERLHSNAGSVATDYMIFMDNIIDSERDVALLRSKKVLKNFLSSDKAAADLFNTLGKGATLSPGSKVGHVQWLVAKHCERPWPKLQASFKHTYLRNPWVFFSAVAAITLVALTILQTVYTVVPFYTEN